MNREIAIELRRILDRYDPLGWMEALYRQNPTIDALMKEADYMVLSFGNGLPEHRHSEASGEPKPPPPPHEPPMHEPVPEPEPAVEEPEEYPGQPPQPEQASAGEQPHDEHRRSQHRHRHRKDD